MKQLNRIEAKLNALLGPEALAELDVDGPCCHHCGQRLDKPAPTVPPFDERPKHGSGGFCRACRRYVA